MQPIKSNMTDRDVGPPELESPFEDPMRGYAPPYSIPFIQTQYSTLPKMVMSEWRPSPEELARLNSGDSIYLAIFEQPTHPMTSMFVGQPHFSGRASNPKQATR